MFSRSCERKIIALIASKNPAPSLEKTVLSLLKGGASKVIVVDDGSDTPKSKDVFAMVKKVPGATVLRLPENIGKAAALKEGFRIISPGSIIVQTDDDTLSGDLLIPKKIITEGEADIVDIRVESVCTKNLLGWIQELDYWFINALIKRIQNVFRARTWMSGASVMYSYEAGEELILQRSYTTTEDTEGLYRARSKGYKVRFCSNKKAAFKTMVPETISGLLRQWHRWSKGNGQVIGLYGFGKGMTRVMNIFGYFGLFLFPIPLVVVCGIEGVFIWQLIYSAIVGLLGAIFLRRPQVLLASFLLPIISITWTVCAAEGLFSALRNPLSVGNMGWTSPKRTGL